MKILSRLFVSALLVSALVPAPARAAAAARAAQQPGAGADVAYSLSMPEPANHLFAVRMAVRNLPPGREYVDVRMPVWTPGSYLVREFARNVQDFATLAASDGAAAPRWEKIDKNTWRVWPGGDRFDVSYRVYANELSVRTSHLDASHGYVNPASVLMYVEEAKSRPLTLTIAAPQNWKISTALERRPDKSAVPTLAAPDYDTLVDSPIEIGTHRSLTFEAAGKPHEVAVWGDGNFDAARLTADMKKIVETAAEIFGKQLPYDRYVFIVHLFPGGGGGLEHKASTTLQAGPYGFQKKESYQGFLGLVAHEYFHLWLVKRIHPPALGPFDYSAENYTKMLWLMEGTTDFYANVLVRRAGLMTEDEYNKELAKSIQALETTPGRRHQSLEEASFDAWIKYYRQNEHSPNSQISYYGKGALVSAMLDLEIKRRTNDAKSLDDVLRYLWTTYAVEGKPVPEDGVQPAVEAVAGGSFEEFFDAYVRGTSEIAYDSFLAQAGLKLVREVKKDDARLDATKLGAWLGANAVDADGRTTIRSVAEGSPAWSAGLNAGDELVAFNGMRVTAATLADRLADRAPGNVVTISVFRRDELIPVRVTLGERPPDTFKIEKIAKAADDKKQPAEKPTPRGRGRRGGTREPAREAPTPAPAA